MEKIEIKDLTFTYPQHDKPALNNINLTINKGELVLICGRSGCGKSTLLRMIKPAVMPHGSLSGTVTADGVETEKLSQREQAEKIGFVFQNPDTQIVCDKVWHELAFGLESLGVGSGEIRIRVAETAAFFGIQNWFYKNITELSGGQKQLLNLASAMVMRPSVLILDEPTSRLDPIAASEFLQAVAKINRELGTTVIITEHRLEEVFPIADKIALLEDGEILALGAANDIGQALKNSGSDMFWALPSAMRIFYLAEDGDKCPITVKDGRRWLENKEILPVADEPHEKNTNPVVFEAEDVWFRYEKNLPDVLKGLNISLHRGELYAITGGNGGGKTTALSVMAGLEKPYRGRVVFNKESAAVMLPQNPQGVFTHKTVLLDLEEMAESLGLDAEEKNKRLCAAVDVCEIADILNSHPYDLSGGELQRAALAMALLRNPDILLLDEPTKGMDAGFKLRLGVFLKELCKNGTGIIMVSHDMEFCARYADCVGMMFDGGIVSAGTAKEFFSGKSFYTTSANRIAGEKLPKAVTDEDVLKALGKKMPYMEKKTADCIKNNLPQTNTKAEKKLSALNIVLGSVFSVLFLVSLYFYNRTETVFAALINILSAGIACFNFIPQRKIEVSAAHPQCGGKGMAAAVLISAVLVPITVLFGIYFLNDRKYYFISFLIILETLAASAAAFEGRKPKAREIIIISVFCATAVAGRAAFAPLPQFKPMAAVIIISGICFGGETGFLVGAVTAFASNFIFGQGPWTPWQMFAFGMIGFLAGVMYRYGIMGKSRTGIALFGFLSVIVVYGGIMNPAAVLMMQPHPTAEMVWMAYIMGFPFDLVHAAATAVFLWLGAEPLCDKTERVKIKYGLK